MHTGGAGVSGGERGSVPLPVASQVSAVTMEDSRGLRPYVQSDRARSVCPWHIVLGVSAVLALMGYRDVREHLFSAVLRTWRSFQVE